MYLTQTVKPILGYHLIRECGGDWSLPKGCHLTRIESNKENSFHFLRYFKPALNISLHYRHSFFFCVRLDGVFFMVLRIWVGDRH